MAVWGVTIHYFTDPPDMHVPRTGEFTHDMLIAQLVSTTIVTRVAAFVSRAFNIIRDKLRALTWFPGRHVLPEARAGTLVLLNSTVCHKGASILRKKLATMYVYAFTMWDLVGSRCQLSFFKNNGLITAYRVSIWVCCWNWVVFVVGALKNSDITVEWILFPFV